MSHSRVNTVRRKSPSIRRVQRAITAPIASIHSMWMRNSPGIEPQSVVHSWNQSESTIRKINEIWYDIDALSVAKRYSIKSHQMMHSSNLWERWIERWMYNSFIKNQTESTFLKKYQKLLLPCFVLYSVSDSFLEIRKTRRCLRQFRISTKISSTEYQSSHKEALKISKIAIRFKI